MGKRRLKNSLGPTHRAAAALIITPNTFFVHINIGTSLLL